MYLTIMIIVFIAGYLLIALEHPIRLDKAASALLTGVVCWTIFILNNDPEFVLDELFHHLGEIASILFFLLCAMTIVELIDSYHGFHLITEKVSTKQKSKLLLIISVITFFLSAVLDNLTTAIVMTSLSSRLLTDKNDKFWFSGIIIIAANAGGAWSPLGDVTTTMLWIGGQITAVKIISSLILPSLVVVILPVMVVYNRFRNQQIVKMEQKTIPAEDKREGRTILYCGIALLLFVPFFKTVTHLPPFMGILFALALLWLITTLMNKNRGQAGNDTRSVAYALRKIDSTSILFFLGILLAVSALESSDILSRFATVLDESVGNIYAVGILLGLLSAIVDNVPLVAAAQGMYSLDTFPTDHTFWEFIALTTGTGGSAIIIGSAAGVAVMGIQKISFGWYLKKISWLALLGFAGGVLVYILQSFL